MRKTDREWEWKKECNHSDILIFVQNPNIRDNNKQQQINREKQNCDK